MQKTQFQAKILADKLMQLSGHIDVLSSVGQNISRATSDANSPMEFKGCCGLKVSCI